MAELADALDLGSSALGMQVQLLSPAPTEIYVRKLRSFIESVNTDSFFVCFLYRETIILIKK